MPDQSFRTNIPEVDPTEIEDNRTAIANEHRSFLEKVQVQAGFADPYDARDFTEVVFRVMRDLMTTEASDRVEAELHTEAVPTDEGSGKYVVIIKLGSTARIIMVNKIPDSTNVVI